MPGDQRRSLFQVSMQLDADALIPGAEINGTIPMWKWIGDEPATTFSYGGRFTVRGSRASRG